MALCSKKHDDFHIDCDKYSPNISAIIKSNHYNYLKQSIWTLHRNHLFFKNVMNTQMPVYNFWKLFYLFTFWKHTYVCNKLWDEFQRIGLIVNPLLVLSIIWIKYSMWTIPLIYCCYRYEIWDFLKPLRTLIKHVIEEVLLVRDCFSETWIWWKHPQYLLMNILRL